MEILHSKESEKKQAYPFGLVSFSEHEIFLDLFFQFRNILTFFSLNYWLDCGLLVLTRKYAIWKIWVEAGMLFRFSAFFTIEIFWLLKGYSNIFLGRVYSQTCFSCRQSVRLLSRAFFEFLVGWVTFEPLDQCKNIWSFLQYSKLREPIELFRRWALQRCLRCKCMQGPTSPSVYIA